jgi:DNA-binding CsgD family transcriptional regulator
MQLQGETAAPASLEILNRRSRPFLIVLDAQLNVICAEDRAFECLGRAYPGIQTGDRRLPESLRRVVETAVIKARTDSAVEPSVVLTGGLVLRIVPLAGNGGAYASVLVEPQARREHLQRAVGRYGLTRRESEVLGCIMDGSNPADIADSLAISPATLKDHLKSLLKKVDARSRSEMLVKIFNAAP